MKQLEQLGRAVAIAQDEQLDRDGVVDATLRLAALPAGGRQLGWVAAAAALVLIAGATAWRFTRAIGIEGDEPKLGVWASVTHESSVRFTDGSTLLIQPGSRFQVAALGNDGADVQVERGHLSVWVPHRARTRWKVGMGPFTIHVVGTRFDTSWDPATEIFLVRLHDGAIRLQGPTLQDEQTIVAGQTFEVRLSAPAALVVVPPVPLPKPVGPAPKKRAPHDGRLREQSPSTWKALAQSGQHALALMAAKNEGWGDLCRTSSAPDALLLGDAARLAGDADSARRAYAALRSRFPQTPQGATATFFLGRLAVASGDAAVAIDWFGRYRAQAPNGPFAAEALGRLIELYRQTSPAQAKEAAREYLNAYPGGPHSRVAKGLLAE